MMNDLVMALAEGFEVSFEDICRELEINPSEMWED